MADFLQVAWAVFLIVAFFGGSIFVHELGHYLAARRRGLKVDRFSIGFGPKIASWQIDGVEWRISLFPLGGYVALPQLANIEGVEGDYKSDPKALPPISYTDTLVVAVMGVIFNIIFALLLASILWVVGKPSTISQQTTTIGEVLPMIQVAKDQQAVGPGIAAGLQPGDRILQIDGNTVSDWRDVKQLIVTGIGRDENKQPQAILTVKRGEQILDITVHPVLTGADKLRSMGLLPEEEMYVGTIFDQSPAQKAGIARGDKLEAINGEKIRTYYAYTQILAKNGDKPLIISVIRDGKPLDYTLAPQQVKVSKDGKKEYLLGMALEPKIIRVYEDPLTQIGSAAALTFRTLGTLIHPDSDIKLNHLSGPPGIAWVIYRLSFDITQVLAFIVMINVNLAILNMLPLPVLDGGHIVLATINKIRGKPVSAEYVNLVQNIFTVMLLGLMVYIIFFSDVPRVGREWKEEINMRQEMKREIAPDFRNPALP